MSQFGDLIICALLLEGRYEEESGHSKGADVRHHAEVGGVVRFVAVVVDGIFVYSTSNCMKEYFAES